MLVSTMMLRPGVRGGGGEEGGSGTDDRTCTVTVDIYFVRSVYEQYHGVTKRLGQTQRDVPPHWPQILAQWW